METPVNVDWSWALACGGSELHKAIKALTQEERADAQALAKKMVASHSFISDFNFADAARSMTRELVRFKETFDENPIHFNQQLWDDLTMQAEKLATQINRHAAVLFAASRAANLRVLDFDTAVSVSFKRAQELARLR